MLDTQKKLTLFSEKKKTFPIARKSFILDLIEFLNLPLLNYIVTRLHYFSEEISLQEKHDTLKDHKWAVGAKDSVNDNLVIKVV